MKTTIVSVEFHGNPILTFNDGQTIRVAMKPVCEGIGLQWEAQLKRIKRHSILAEGMSIMDIPSEGGIQLAVTLPLDMLNGWLFGVEPNKVRPEIKDKLIEYQRECFTVLHDYWAKKSQPAPASLPAIPQIPDIQDYVCQDGTAAAKRLRTFAEQNLTGAQRDYVLNECRTIEKTLTAGWTDMDETIFRMTMACNILKRWRGVH